MYYTIYKTTNKINNKIYIGLHRTKNPYDAYFGSGKALLRAIEKYGKESFSKEVLYIFDNEDDMISKEAEIVNEVFIKDDGNYNLAEGGRTAKGYRHTEEWKKAQSERMKGQNHPFYGKSLPEETRKKQSVSINKYYENRSEEEREAKSKTLSKSWNTRDKEAVGRKISEAVKGKPKSEEHKEALRKAKATLDNSHTEETKKKISESMRGKKKPEGVYKGCQKGKKKNFKAVVCPHCKKEGKGPTMYRYHMDNCKERKKW